jgi:transcriptional regulator with XRE-family HTH domain
MNTGMKRKPAEVPGGPEYLWLKNLGARIRALRLLRGLKQQALALPAGLSQSTVSRIEQGLVMPTISQLAVFAQVLGTTLDQLLRREEAGFTIRIENL